MKTKTTKKSKSKRQPAGKGMDLAQMINFGMGAAAAMQATASRDKFAEVAMGKLLVVGLDESEKIDCEAIADDAFKLADAMMKARQVMPDEVASIKS